MRLGKSPLRYGIIFLTLAGLFVVQAILWQGGYWLLLWPAISFAVVGAAYLGLGAVVFGKRADGTLAWWAVLLLLPYLLFTWAIWHVTRLLSREPCWHEVTPGLFVGRRPLAGEVPAEVTLLVDLTAEFRELASVRRGREYLAAPTLDAGIGDPAAFRALVTQIAAWPGPVYIHCAQGHGRTGTLAAAVLVVKGRCTTVDDAVALLRSVRPGLRLNERQLRFVQSACEEQRS